MSGSPAARLGDGIKGSKIIQGSRTVLIGSQGGVACSECPGGVAVGQPVSISLGAKVLSGSIDQDFALPGAMPLAWQRQYSSYVNAEHGGACGVFGYGWKSPLELQLLLVNEQAQLFDTAGRLITFEDRLGPGSALYSPSEDIWLLRGGMLDDATPHLAASHTPATSKPASVVFSSPGLMIGSGPGKQTSIGSAPKDISGSESADDAPSVVHRIEASDAAHWCAREQWQHIPADWASNPNTIIATNGNGQVLWRFEPEAVISASIVNSQRWLLTNKRDRLGREQKLHYASRQPEAQRHVLDTQGQPSDIELPAHLPIAIEDGLGRYYQLQYQCSSASAAIAWQKRLQERITAISKGQEPPAWDVSRGHQGQAGWQMDSGIRLASISVTHSKQSSAPSLAAVPLVRYTYSAAGDLTGVYDRSGTLVREFKYANHLMVAHRHRQGPWHRYVYETEDAQHTTALPGARVKVHTNQEGLDWQFDYQTDPLDPKRSTTLVQDSLGRQERYDFQGLGGLKRLVSHTRADGSITKTGYNGFGHPTSTTNALGHSSYMSRDGQGRIITTQSPEGLHTQASYNALGLLSTTEDANGIRTRYDYDRYGRLHRITTQARGSRADEEPLEHRYHYPDPNEQPLIAHLPSTITDARGGTKQLSYNQAGQQTRYTDCSGQSTYWGWDEWGQLIITSDAQGNSQHYTYDAAGQLLSTELANGQRMHNQWSESGQLVRSWLEDSQGLQVADTEVQLHYDLWGRLIEREQSGSSLKLRYDKAARLVELINENGASSRFGWDVMDRQSEEQGLDGRLQRYQYDAAGQLSAHQDGHQHSEPKHWLYNQYRFGKDGQLLQILSNQHSDDPSNPGTVQRMQELHYTTGLFNRICSYVQQPGDQEQWLESETLIERDQLGRMIGEVQRLWAQPGSPQAKPDNPHLLNPITKRPPPEHEYHIRHQLDALGNRIRTEQSQLPATHYLLYGAGHVHGIHINGQEVLAIERDSLHRETQRRYGNGISQTQSYTALGQLRSQEWQLQQHASDPLIGQFKERHYHYDPLGQITAVTHGQHTHTPQDTHYRYDSQGRLTAAQQRSQTQAQHWRFDPAGNRLPNVANDTNAQATWAAQVKAQWHNPRFNPLGDGQIDPNERVHQWPHNRVHYTEAALYRYDGRGNRTRSAQLADGSSQDLRFDSSNQLIALGTYNAQGQLTSTSSYRYDSLGRRMAQTVQTYSEGEVTSNEATYYGWDGDRLVYTKSQQGTTSTLYEPGSFTPLIQLYQADQSTKPALTEQEQIFKQIEITIAGIQHHLSPLDAQRQKEAVFAEAKRQLTADGKWQDREDTNPLQIRYYHCNQIGTPLALSDAQGQIVWAAQYDPWGNVQREYSADPEHIRQDIRLPGQHHDRKTELYYNRYRYYDPQLGAYINQDPIGLRSGEPNFFNYPQNPNQWIDFLGLVAQVIVNGNDVRIKIPIKYTGSGITENISEKFNNGISQYWTGQFGKYNVTTTVEPISCCSSVCENIIDVPAGNGRAYVMGVGGSTGTWPAERPAWTAAHEAGHLMGLPDRYTDTGGVLAGYENNIMATHGGLPSESDITAIIEGNQCS